MIYLCRYLPKVDYMKTMKINKGDQYNCYTIIKEVGRMGKARRVLAECECGTIKEVDFQALKRGTTKSCGCYKFRNQGLQSVKHGLWKHPLYSVWSGAKRRCTNPDDRDFKHYGGRGITFNSKWMNNFKLFYDWAINNGWTEGLQLDRIENDKGYHPNNCKFSTSKQNCRNKRNNIRISYNGETKTLTEWAIVANMAYSCFWHRYKRGMEIKDIIETPIKKRLFTQPKND